MTAGRGPDRSGRRPLRERGQRVLAVGAALLVMAHAAPLVAAPWSDVGVDARPHEWSMPFATRLDAGPADSLAAPGLLAVADGGWADFPPPPEWFRTPPWRQGCAVAFDTHRNRMVVLAGGGTTLLDDVWALTPGAMPYWEEILPLGERPAPRRLVSAVYDPLRRRILLFGGYDGGFFNDLWELSLGGAPEWRRLEPDGPSPAPRADFSMIYDPVADRILLFGGYDGSSPTAFRRNDLWQLALSGTPTWSEITVPEAPTPRSGHAAFFDPVEYRMVVFGGYDVAFLDEAWALTLADPPAWLRIDPAGGPKPRARAGHSWAYDSARHRGIVFGGTDLTTWFADTWELDLASSAWRLLEVPNTPIPRTGQAMAHDPTGDQMLMFSGFAYLGKVGDTWALSLADPPEWNRTALPAPSPGLRSRHTLVVDSRRQRLLMMGGTDGEPLRRNDVWELSLAGDARWAQLATSGEEGQSRQSHAAIYDPVGDRMIVFAGYGLVFHSDVQALSFAHGARWSTLRPDGPGPSRRVNCSMIYDPRGHRAIVFGGTLGSLNPGNDHNDVWALHLGDPPRWEEITPTEGPSPRWGHSAIHDPLRDRMLVLGGYDTQRLDELWSLSLTGTPRWTRIATLDSGPTPRYGHTAVHDPGADRMLVFGGTDPAAILDELWSLSLADHRWRRLSTSGPAPTPRYWHGAVFDPLEDRMIVHGGERAHPRVFFGDALSYDPDRPPPIAIELELPGALNLESRGRWVSARLEPESGFPVGDIVLASIRLSGDLPGAQPVPVDPDAPTSVGDGDRDGLPDLTVKFDRAAVELTFGPGPEATATVRGILGGRAFEGATTLRLLRGTVVAPAPASTVAAATRTTVRWQPPPGAPAAAIRLLLSEDGGARWSIASTALEPGTSLAWAVPATSTESARIAVAAVAEDDSAGLGIATVLAISEPFSIAPAVTSVETISRGFAILHVTPNPGRGPRLLSFTLPARLPARLEVFDLAGRRLLDRDLGPLAEGRHDLVLDAAFPVGIHLARLTQGGAQRVARFVVLEH